MSIESEINRINTNVQNTLAAIEEMGGEVPEDGNSDDMAGGVRTIPVGAKIDDTTPSASTTYSSEKIEAELSKQKEANEQQDEAIAKKLNASELPTAINTALAQAKERGEFDGAPGAPGAPGEPGNDGHTPEKGVDYWTVEDKAGIVSDVLAALPTWEGGAY